MPWVIYSGHGHLLDAPNKTYRAVIRNGAGPLILLLCLTRSSRRKIADAVALSRSPLMLAAVRAVSITHETFTTSL